MSASFDYSKINLYDVLGLQIDATEKDVIKAYRKKALKYHPDKNSDPSAVEIFHKLSKALEILTDEKAKAAYDKVLKARAAAEVRHKQLDAKRQKLKEDLEAREQAGLSETAKKAQQARNLQAEIERLRKEGSSLLEREQALLREELARQVKEEQANSTSKNTEDEPIRLKLKWKCSKSDLNNGGYNEDVIRHIFNKYGNVGTVLLSAKKNGTAVVEFDSSNPKLSYADTETGLPGCPLTITWISGKPSLQTTQESQNTAQERVSEAFQSAPLIESTQAAALSSDSDFESLVLMKMRQAEERKKLIEQMKREDEEEEAKSNQ